MAANGSRSLIIVFALSFLITLIATSSGIYFFYYKPSMEQLKTMQTQKPTTGTTTQFSMAFTPTAVPAGGNENPSPNVTPKTSQRGKKAEPPATKRSRRPDGATNPRIKKTTSFKENNAPKESAKLKESAPIDTSSQPMEGASGDSSVTGSAQRGAKAKSANVSGKQFTESSESGTAEDESESQAGQQRGKKSRQHISSGSDAE